MAAAEFICKREPEKVEVKSKNNRFFADLYCPFAIFICKNKTIILPVDAAICLLPA
ncbi:hypothetical protein [Calothrix sp. UHCC 0171]|uniref:hypothetical protein n=1 Tax=Calothrix sp. UHCC 0171 TaxID=3110245 RepID=UPI002B21072A|nr:hypothetical protein [Calothrix sp. UHCC 0171]MEA5569973.1 hypothetical protein [Calothrix sp. UHCC 0171]